MGYTDIRVIKNHKFQITSKSQFTKCKLQTWLLLAMMGLVVWKLAEDSLFIGRRVLGEATQKGDLETRIAALESRVYRLEQTTGLIKKTKATLGKAKEYFVALSGGSAEGYDWTKITGSDFTFDTSLYGSNITVSWEGWMDNGLGNVRIYDATNFRGVDGSEIKLSSGEKSSFYSKNLSIWRGQNQYYLQIKSIAGLVTISQPRLKVVAQ